ncbi:MAG: hypothetical protein JST22_01515 [Bacteroidetes bacterium]|nr:hypothetical protein [Bacteroidota bacterium]
MNEQSTAPELQQQYRAIASDALAAGVPPAGVQAALVEHGMENDAAANMVSLIVNERNFDSVAAATVASDTMDPETERARKDMIAGGIICLIGIAVTIVSYVAASNGGGRYVVTWGAVLFGGIRFFRGYARYRA